jgi:error-prone DNA polymerase
MPSYAELQVTTNFSFLRGASHPEEMTLQAAAFGYTAIGITDRNSLAGVVRAHIAAKEAGIQLCVGARLDLVDGFSLLAYPTDRAAYGRLSRLITIGRRRAPKGECEIGRQDVLEWGKGIVFLVVPPSQLVIPARVEIQDGIYKRLDSHPHRNDVKELGVQLNELNTAFPGNCYIVANHLLRGDDKARLACLANLAKAHDMSLVAANDAHMHSAARRPLADVVTCIREKCTLDEAGYRLVANAERHLKPPEEMALLFRDYPDAVVRTVEIAKRCRFSLDELRYEYPDAVSPDGTPPQEALEEMAWDGAKQRYPDGIPRGVREQVEHELKLIGKLSYAPYFLTVHDVVRFARGNDILCQGRGSAANSAVCYCLGITAVDPSKVDLLFERFVSLERNEPPDIDVDFEHERREEVIQYIYEKYGRERAGMTATVIRYRTRRAIREVGKVLGLSKDTIGALASQTWDLWGDGVEDERVQELGLSLSNRRLRLALRLTKELIGFPRHLSQHVGGFVITRRRLDEVVPIENAAMEGRTVIEWDKNDLDALGILKIDVLALGMLSCIHRGFDLLRRHHGRNYDLATVPPEDSAVYDMLCRADSLGVFQVESRAQMSFLPRMKPRNFYDLVIEVAIVRPGPIQGDMVHPYLRRRNGEEKVTYPSEALRQVLEKTLGVPLFQEQAMKIAIVGAGFEPSEADKLRCAMATFRKAGTIHSFRKKFIDGMVENGYECEFSERCFQQIEGFGEYGFPESHAASFALLVYVSAWLKCRYPAVFAAALLNSQPMGFYAPAQIVRDAREHGIEVRPIDVNYSEWDCTLETSGGALDGPGGGYALRLGFRQVKGVGEEDADWLVAARGNGYRDPLSIWRRASVAAPALEKLARADAFASMGMSRRDALWAIKPLQRIISPLPLFAAAGAAELGEEPDVPLPRMTVGEEVVEDYANLRLTLRSHPLRLLRHRLRETTTSGRLVDTKDGTKLSVAGLVLVRQRPGTAKGVIFATLEDETGVANIIVWPKVLEQYRRVVLTARLMQVTGRLQREGIVTHLIADKVEDMSYLLDSLEGEEGFQLTSGLADGISNPGRDENHPPTKRFGTIPPPRHPRGQAEVIFPSSRDFR